MPLPAGVETVTVSTGGVPLTLPDGSFVQGSFYFDAPDVATIAGEDLLFGGTVKADLVDGEFSVTLVATDATGVSPSGGTYTVRAALSNAPSWTRYVSLPKAVPSVVLADVIVADPVAGSYSTLADASTLLAKASNLSDLADAATARSNLGLGGAAVLDVGTAAGTVAAGDDSRLSDARTPTAHAASHAAAGSDPVTLTQAQITGLVAALAALAPLAGATFTGDLNIAGANVTVQRGDGTGAYRFRVTGGGLDLEIGGLDVTVSAWSNADFTGTQSNVMRLEPAGPHLIGDTQFGTTPYDRVHSIDAGTGVAGLGAKNSLVNINFCGRLATAGAPSTGTWAAGDTVQDSEGTLWLCTAGGTPGTWTGRASKPWVFDITDYGAIGDAVIVSDGAVTGGTATLTCATSTPFAAGDVGKSILIQGAGATGVTAFATTIASFTSSSVVGLTDTPPTTITGGVVAFGTNSYDQIRAAQAAANAYRAAGGAAKLFTPVGGFILDGPLDTSLSGNGKVVFGPDATTGQKSIPYFKGAVPGAGVRHWEQTVPQMSGSCWISFGFYTSTAAQTADINANGNPGIISGPTEANGYGVSGQFSNTMPVIEDMAFLVPHTAYGITQGAWNFYGCANAHIKGDVSISTLGVVPGSDYSSPGVFATGLSAGCLMPAPGNNDLSVIDNLSIQGGFTYGILFSEHTLIGRIMGLYCWSPLVPVGTYAGSVGSVHAMKIASASVESCVNEVFIYGAGSSGVGPIIDIDQLSTESSTPNIAGSSSTAVNSARGRIKLTGLFTESGVSTQYPTGIEIVNGQVPRAIKRKTGAFTASPIDRVLVCDTTTAGFTGTLPAADFCPVEYVFRNVGVNTLTVASTSSQPIYLADGTSATSTALANGASLRVQALYDGTGWGWYAV